MYDDIKSILRDTYELEGLLLLADSRGEETPEMVLSAIAEKAEAIAANSKRISIKPAEKPDNATEKLNASNEELMESCSNDMVRGFVEEVIADTTYETEKAEKKEPEAESISDDSMMEGYFADDKDIAINDEQQETETESEEIPATDMTTSISEPEAPEQPENESELPEPENKQPEPENEQITLDEAFIRNKSKDLHKAFSINDMFRFRRELFGNSAAEMTDAIDLVDAMGSYSEAEDYFYNDLGWDKDSEEVAEFMEIIKNHFL